MRPVSQAQVPPINVPARAPEPRLRCPPLGSDAPLTRIGSTVFYGANVFTVVKQALTVDVGKHCAVNEQQLSQIFHSFT